MHGLQNTPKAIIKTNIMFGLSHKTIFFIFLFKFYAVGELCWIIVTLIILAYEKHNLYFTINHKVGILFS